MTAAEALGYGEHPRVGLAVACSGDVYTAKAARWGVAQVDPSVDPVSLKGARFQIVKEVNYNCFQIVKEVN